MEKQSSSTRHHRRRIFAAALAAFSVVDLSRAAVPIHISKEDALRIGKRVWQNESNGSIAGLTAWNAGEDFASLGIGHFIWYPQGLRGPFEESFPKFLAFAQERKVTVPVWLNQATACPWNSRAEFLQARNSVEMNQLRRFLADTIDLQAEFLVARLEALCLKCWPKRRLPTEVTCSNNLNA